MTASTDQIEEFIRDILDVDDAIVTSESLIWDFFGSLEPTEEEFAEIVKRRIARKYGKELDHIERYLVDIVRLCGDAKGP